jgi:hypothetical protein
MNSKAFEEFINLIKTNGRMQGYNPKLLELINPDEKAETEKLIIDNFSNGDIEMAVFMPKLSSVDGVKLLKEKLKDYKNPSYAYCQLTYILYDAIKEDVYLDSLISILDYDNQDERMNAVMALLRCPKNEKLYVAFKNGCLKNDNEIIRSRCAIGMLYCKDIVSNPLRIQTLENKWKDIKIRLYDNDAAVRKKAVEDFESMIAQ